MREGGVFSFLSPWGRLIRIRVSLMVALSTAFGFLLYSPVVHWDLLVVSLASFLITAACSIFNQIQERDLDKLFERTRMRPLVTGDVSTSQAFLYGAVLALSGMSVFFLLTVRPSIVGQLLSASLGIFVSYNLCYTPLKRVTPFALLVGALSGAFPPVMGWLAAGGEAFSPAILLVYMVYYLWQVPHFWLRAERDCKEYQAAGVPVPCFVFGRERYDRLLRLWYYAYLIALLMLPVFPLMQSVMTRVLFLCLAMAMILGAGVVLQRRTFAFHAVNFSLLGAVFLLLLDTVVG